MPLTGHPFAPNPPWSAEAVVDIMRSIVTDAEDDISGAVGTQLLTRVMLFLSRLSIRIQDEIFDFSEEEDGREKEQQQEEDGKMEGSSVSQFASEEEMDSIAKKIMKHFEDPEFVSWMMQLIERFSERLNANVDILEIANLLGVDVRGVIDALIAGESVMPHAPCRLRDDAVEKLSTLGVNVYQNMIYDPEFTLARPSVMALQFSKLADGPEKTEEDVEDEALMESYVSSHPSEIMVIEKEELYGVIKETLEEYKGNLERFISAYGPKYVEILLTRSILPLLEQS